MTIPHPHPVARESGVMSRRILVHNAGPGALVFTQGGRALSPFKTAESHAGDLVTARLVASGRLIDVTPKLAPAPTSRPTRAQAPTPEEVEQPSGNASRDEWEAYALQEGYTAEELEGLGRNDIRDLLTDHSTVGEEHDTDAPVDGDETTTQTATSPGDADPSEKEQ